jgi:hypothetical protein
MFKTKASKVTLLDSDKTLKLLGNRGKRIIICRGFMYKSFTVILWVTRELEVLFTVNNSFTKTKSNPREGAIILRTLKREWESIVNSLPNGLWCYPEDDDGLGGQRRYMYGRLGFTLEKGDGGIYYDDWVSNNPFKEEDLW